MGEVDGWGMGWGWVGRAQDGVEERGVGVRAG